MLKEDGVVFRGEPKNMGAITAVLFEDTRGSLINLVQPMAPFGSARQEQEEYLHGAARIGNPSYTRPRAQKKSPSP
jgi:hypothetical protein